MKKLFLISFLFSSLTLFGQYQSPSMLSDSAWVYVYGGSGHDFARQIISTIDSGYLVVGTTSSFGVLNTDIYVIKTDKNCRHEWSHIYGSANIEWGFGARQTFDNGYILCGFSNQNQSTGYDIYLVKIDSSGNEQWAKTIGDTDWDFGYGIENSSDSGFIIIGKTYSQSNGGSDLLIMKTDSLGNMLWKRNYGGTLDETANTIYKTKEGNYLVLGETNSFGAGGTDFYLVKINESGDTLWSKTYGTTENDAGNSIDTTYAGNYFLFGTSEGNPSRPGKEFYIIRTDTAGNTLYSVFDGGPGEEIGRYIIQLKNGDYIFGGTTNSNGLGHNALYMIGFKSNGTFLGGAYFGGTEDEEGYGVAAGKDGQIVFAGTTTSENFGGEDVYLVRIDSVHSYYPLSMHYHNDSLVSVEEVRPENSRPFFIYPDPLKAGDPLFIDCIGNTRPHDCTITISEITGRQAQTIQTAHLPYRFENSSFLSKGVYIISIFQDTVFIQSEKIIIY